MLDTNIIAVHIGPPGAVSVRESARAVLSARQGSADAELWLAIQGYDDDQREIWEIPEARDYTRQVLNAVVAVDGRWWADVRMHESTMIWLGLTLGVARQVPGGVQFMRPDQTGWDD